MGNGRRPSRFNTIGVKGAEELHTAFPIPTQIVASDEFQPVPQTLRQRAVEARLLDLAGALAPRHGLDRRGFFRSASGMAAAFLAINGVFGPLFAVNPAEAAEPDAAMARAAALRGQHIVDVHTHFLRDDTRLTRFVDMRKDAAARGWNPALHDKPQTIEHLKFDNWFKEIFLDSDTRVALISGAPSEIAADWFLTNRMAMAARDRINQEAGSRRAMAHAVIQPGARGWLDAIDADIAGRPDAFKGYTIGDNTHKNLARPWRLDDEALVYPFYEKAAKAGIRNICIHKGLFATMLEKQYPHLRPYADVSDVARAARDWPQLNFLIYHAGYRHVGGQPGEAWAEFSRTGRLSWVSDLADIPHQYGVTNIYADIGQSFATTIVDDPRVAAAMLGILVNGLGPDHILWGTDAVWTGSPQWQIEGLRRLEIPDAMREKHGFDPLGAADGPTKTAIFGGNATRLFHMAPQRAADRFDMHKAHYLAAGPAPGNRRYGYILA